jgi:phage terminase large subunit
VGKRSLITIPYSPRPLQADIHGKLKRFNVLVCHRRFGKTVLCVIETIRQALTLSKPRPRYAYLAPQYRQAKRAAWDSLKFFTAPIPGRTVNETELRVDFVSGARISLLGAEDPDSLRGIYLDGVVLDEFAMMRPRVWSEVVRPALADRNGWAIFIGTPRGRNEFHKLYERARDRPDWFAALYRASKTNVIAESELLAARRDMEEEEYEQEFECSFDAAIVGAYYGKLIAAAEREGRLANVPWDPAVPGHTVWDLGIGDSTAIWSLQLVGREVHWIDFYEASGVGLYHYAKMLQDRPYIYGEHLLPHDAAARELGTGRSRVETLRRLGVKARVLPREGVDDGIQAVRLMIPRSWFDAGKCAAGLEALRNYRREWDEKRDNFRPRPLHDWSSHAADAARAAAMGLPEGSRERSRAMIRTESAYDPHKW